jgi:myo-inositol 2-dehydrogenase/D-chiro-inositol 1-dehydrogenase
MNALRVGIIGCGRMGKERARCVSALGATVAFIHDVERSRADELARAYPGCAVATDTSEVVCARPDALFVCTPPSARGFVEMEAIALGVPFFVEKPIGISAQNVAPVRDALRKASLIHAVGYMNRVRLSVEHARRILHNRQILAISGYWVGRKYLVPWWLRSSDSGGPVNEQATHLIDLSRFLGGNIVGVSFTTGSILEKSDSQLSAAFLLAFESGALGSLFYSCEAKDKQIALRVITPEGGLDLTGWDLRLTSNTIDGSGVCDAPEDIFLSETGRFLAAVASKNVENISCTFEDAWQTQLVVDRLRSAGVSRLETL